MKSRQCRMAIFFITTLGLLAAALHPAMAGPLAPKRLRLEYLREPLGIDVPKPRFSWSLEHTDRDQGQTAYHLQVAKITGIRLSDAKKIADFSKSVGLSSLDALAAHTMNVWDSGVVKSSRSTNVEYNGEALESDTVYMWTVSYEDRQGTESPQSNAFFTTALFSPTDWGESKWLDGEQGNQLRATFNVKPEVNVTQAFCYVAGMGYYHMRLNGHRVSDHVLGPFTTFEKRIHYYTHDITELIASGQTNVITVTLGHGWYSQPTVNVGGRTLRLKCSLKGDSYMMSVISNAEEWTQTTGPIVLDDIYIGETYNASMETPGWDLPNFDDSNWKRAKALPTAPTGTLSSPMMPAIRKVQTYTAIKLSEPAPGVFVFDFGQNMAGLCTLAISNVEAEEGSNVTLQYAEMLREDGFIQHRYPKSPERAVYIFSGKEDSVTFEPYFTYFGFRYVQMTGFPGTPSMTSTLVAHFVHTDLDMTGNIEFSPSGHILNKIQHITRFASLSNYMDIPTDCPQRERRGWLGDAQVSAETTIYNFDMAAAYTKFMRDIRDTQELIMQQNGSDGTLPDCAPWYHHGKYPADPAWGAAYTFLLDWMMTYYDDDRLLNETYHGARDHMFSLIAEAEADQPITLLNYSVHGDWCSLQNGVSCRKNSTLVSTFYYIFQLEIMSRLAMYAHNSTESKDFGYRVVASTGAFVEHFYDSAAKQFTDVNIGPQTGNPLGLLVYGVNTPDNVKAVVEKIVEDVVRNDYHLDTGIVGTKYLLPTLSKYGHHDVAMKVAAQTTFPSWGYMVTQGATTLWENWQGTHFTGVGSRNHIMFGSQSSWYYQSIAGINLVPHTRGWQHILIAPQILTEGDDVLEGVDASISTIRGTVTSSWALTQSRVCAEADYHQTAMLSCPTPQDTIADVVFASYGLPTGTCGDFANSPNCSAKMSVGVVRDACVGKHSCAIVANSSVFHGDPCPGQHKHLYIQVTCTVSQIYSLHVQIPGGSEAEVQLPLVNGLTNTTARVYEGSHTVWSNGKFNAGDDGVQSGSGTSGRYIAFNVGSGTYLFYMSKG